MDNLYEYINFQSNSVFYKIHICYNNIRNLCTLKDFCEVFHVRLGLYLLVILIHVAITTIEVVLLLKFTFLIFFLSSSLVARNSTFKVDKWDDQGSNPDPCIYNAIVQSIELSSRDTFLNLLYTK
jgi:hypothetical protein